MRSKTDRKADHLVERSVVSDGMIQGYNGDTYHQLDREFLYCGLCLLWKHPVGDCEGVYDNILAQRLALVVNLAQLVVCDGLA